jgi:hypothetical protein
MPLGLLGSASGRTLQIRLAENIGAGGLAAPTTPGDGFDLLGGPAIFKRFVFADRGTIVVSKAPGCGPGVSIASARIFGFYNEHLATFGPEGWGPMGPGSVADRGKLNQGAAGVIAEITGSTIMLLEDVDGLLTIERIAVALGAITVSSGDALVNVDLILKRRTA